jgi:hypothetical protein
MRDLICERCRTKFICNGSESSCWCFQISYVRLDKTEQYKDCLCEKCLIELENETSQNHNKG